MQRRNFLHQSVGLSTLLGTGLAATSCNKESRLPKKNADEIRIERVIRAMLTIQRASWEHGVAMQALLELGEEELVIMMAKEAVLRQTGEGQLSVVYTDNGVTDPAASGEGVLYAWKNTGEEKFKTASEKMLQYLLHKAPNTNGIIHHVKHAPEVWIDAMYMAPPFLSLSGEHAFALRQIHGWKDCLWDEKEELFSHNYNIKEKKFIRKDFWGVGNGWALAGIARVITSLPEEMHMEKEELISLERRLIVSLLKYMRPDGLFHDVVNQPQSFVETNLSQMLAYTIYRGMQEGWMEKIFHKEAEKLREAAIAKVDKFGFVQGVCGAPHFNSAGTAAEGQAFHILMEAARKKFLSS